MIDESTDVGNKKQLIVYIKYYDPLEFAYRTSFFRILELTGTTAESIYFDLLTLLETYS
jgi:hypothetical protein